MLGLPRLFRLDAGELQRRFYLLSRELHPDRFTHEAPEFRSLSLQRMSWVNDAYRLLRDPQTRRETLLELEGIPSEKTGASLPVELAEAWFELQEVVQEMIQEVIQEVISKNGRDSVQSASSQALLARQWESFEKELRDYQQAKEARLNALAEQADALVKPGSSADLTKRRALLEQIRVETRALAYVKSLERDRDRIRSNLTSKLGSGWGV